MEQIAEAIARFDYEADRKARRAAIRVKNRHTYCTSYTVHINGRVIESFYDKKLAVECRNEWNANFAW